MRRKLLFSLVAEVLVLSMVALPAIIENDQTPGDGAYQVHPLGTLPLIGVSHPQNVDMDTPGGSVNFVLLTAKIAIFAKERTYFVVSDRDGRNGRVRSQPPDAGIDPFIAGARGTAARRRIMPFEAS